MKSKKFFFASPALILLVLVFFVFAQELKDKPAEFAKVVENRLNDDYRTTLEKICPVEDDPTAKRIFVEYGAIFVSSGTMLPSKCIFASDADLQNYQVRLETETVNVGGIAIQLQKPAMQALLKARQEAAQKNLQITPRGTLAAKRSYQQTLKLWNSRFFPALNYWTGRGKITTEAAAAAKSSDVPEQIRKVLEWEEKGMPFGKDMNKSIFYSVAAPGASQHNFMLALDVEQFSNNDVRKILAANGWFQTVKGDAPHFTYLGVKETELPALGLKSVTVGSQKFWIPNYTNQK